MYQEIYTCVERRNKDAATSVIFVEGTRVIVQYVSVLNSILAKKRFKAVLDRRPSIVLPSNLVAYLTECKK